MLDIKNSVTEMRNAFDGLISRPDTAEGRISELHTMEIKTSKTEKNREQRLIKTEQHVRGLWDNYKRCNICAMGISEGEERKRTNPAEIRPA